MAPGADVDHSGTPFTEALLGSLLHALRDPDTHTARIGRARFMDATFTGAWAGFGKSGFAGATFIGPALFDGATFGLARFDGATFASEAGFSGATFTGDACFGGAKFTGYAAFGEAKFNFNASFNQATFTRDAWFAGATFSSGGAWFNSSASFDGTMFNSSASFDGTTFTGDARFDGTTFTGDADFGRATFARDAWFGRASFAVPSHLEPLVCSGTVTLSGAVFEAPVTLEVAAQEVHCVRTRWESTATMRLRYATVDLSDAVLSAPMAVTAHSTAFATNLGGTLDEKMLILIAPDVRLTSLQGVDAAHMVLADIDLTTCLFSRAFHLDRLRLEGRCAFTRTPTGLHWRKIWPYWWSRRRTLAEEHHWRAHRAGAGNPDPPRGWQARSGLPGSVRPPKPEYLAATYRQLRKAFEDSKNEPGAADFYYGEMEMRRHDLAGTTVIERVLVRAYWLLSGYGLRASRALLWLGLAMSGTVLALMLWGLPTTVPLPSATGTATGSTISLKTDKPDLSITGDRWTLQRADRAVRVSVNAVVFRTSGQNLTRAGSYVEMVSKIIEPILLALAVLAVRERVKR
ncbi:pentapeptide repeat-containing protein [Streptomyces griseochromogenes]|uniref:pentapeptide repeat-containing protein n=1 Tax=Streptomyces griseochromogenes TaxID=68214 RepID=UPI003AAFB999